MVTPRSANKKATGLEVMEEPRSAWRVNWPGAMFCLSQVDSIILAEELRKAEIVIEVQKKVATLLGRPILAPDREEKP